MFDNIWCITDPHAVEVMFEHLMGEIARSNPASISFVVDSIRPGTYLALVPHVPWGEDQLDMFRKAVREQIPVLVKRAEAGDQFALKALIDLQSGPLFDEQYRVEELYPIFERIENLGHVAGVIRSLLTSARTDLASLKAAADMCCEQGYMRDENEFAKVLPSDMTIAELQELVDRYNREAPAQDLPPLSEHPFDEE